MKTYEKYPNRGLINYEDDIVVVFNEKGEEIYKGLEDYEPMRREPWEYDFDIDAYRFENYIKVCIGEGA